MAIPDRPVSGHSGRDQSSSDQLAPPSTGVRVWRLVMASAAGVESLALAAAAVFVVVELFVAEAGNVPRAFFLALLAALGAAGMSAVTVGLFRGRRWSRAPAATWQLLQASIALPALGMGNVANTVGVVLLALCVLVLAGVLQARLFEGLTPPR